MTMRKAPPSNQASPSAREPQKGRREMDLEMYPVTMHEVVRAAGQSRAQYLHLLSRLLLTVPAGSSGFASWEELQTLSEWDSDEVSRFLAFADLHHVLVRAVEAVPGVTNGTASPRCSDPPTS